MLDFIKKYKIEVALGVTIALFVLTSTILGYLLNASLTKLEQKNIIIESRNEEIQAFDKELSIAESKLLTLEDLNNKYKKEIKDMDSEFKKIVSKYDLELQSRENTIASLIGQIKGGVTEVVVINDDGTISITDNLDNVDGRVISYTWSDTSGRFLLQDPDILISGNEKFSYKQSFRVKGHVFTDETGNVQVKKVEMSEVIVDENGEYVAVENSNMTLVSSDFEYTNKDKQKSILDIVTLRPIATFDTAIMPGIGLEFINLGRYFDYANVGIYSKVAFDVSDPLGGSLQRSRAGIGVSYHIVPPLINTNFAVGVSATTPFNDVGKVMISADAILYLTDDLNPFLLLK